MSEEILRAARLAYEHPQWGHKQPWERNPWARKAWITCMTDVLDDGLPEKKSPQELTDRIIELEAEVERRKTELSETTQFMWQQEAEVTRLREWKLTIEQANKTLAECRANVEARDRITELEAEVARLKAENEELRNLPGHAALWQQWKDAEQARQAVQAEVARLRAASERVVKDPALVSVAGWYDSIEGLRAALAKGGGE